MYVSKCCSAKVDHYIRLPEHREEGWPIGICTKCKKKLYPSSVRMKTKLDKFAKGEFKNEL